MAHDGSRRLLDTPETVTSLVEAAFGNLGEDWKWRPTEDPGLGWIFFQHAWAADGHRIHYSITASLDTRMFIVHHSGGSSGTWAERLRQGDPATTMKFDLLLMCAADGSFRQPCLDEDTATSLGRWLKRVAKRNPPNGLPAE